MSVCDLFMRPQRMPVVNKYRLKKLDCPDCAAKLETALRKLPGVKSVSLDFSTQTMLLECQNLDEVRKEIARLEPEVRLQRMDAPHEEFSEVLQHRQELLLLGVSAVLFVVALLSEGRFGHSWKHVAEYALYLLVYLLVGGKVIGTALRNISRGRIFDESFLMTVSTLGALAIHAPAEAAGVMLFYRFGEFLQEVSVQRSRRSIKALIELRPDQANVIHSSGEIRIVAPEQVAPGSRILVRPGERIPLDGTVLSGQSLLDTSALTGEAVPRQVREEDTVLAGMINKQGLLTVQVTRRFQESSLARILELVENAAHKKAGTELFFTTFARYYTPVVVALAALTAILPPLLLEGATFSNWLYRALVLLVISCPCALVVSIPLTYFGAIGAASRKGILIKGSGYLDALRGLTTIYLDKTGTLTRGVFRVREVCPADGFTEPQLLELAALAEAHSNHPIALSIRAACGVELDFSRIQEYEALDGSGVRALVDQKRVLAGNDRILHQFEIPHPRCEIPGTVVHLAVDQQYAGYLIIGDELKADSAKAIAELRQLGIKDLIMLTGDNQITAEAVANEAGLDHFEANLLPEDKVNILEKALHQPNRKGKIAFVGDGVNDAPVLTRADIGISMGSLGSDAAIETADIVIMNDSLAKIPEVLRLARKNRSILLQNIIFALGIKIAFMAFGIAGQTSLWEAVFADMGVALIAIFNATRMLEK